MKSFYDGKNNVCQNITAKDINDAYTEWKEYQNQKGRIYALETMKQGTFSRFCAMFFGFCDYDAFEYTDFPYFIPFEFTCTNKNVAEKLYNFLKGLQYHNSFKQVYRVVELNGKTVYVSAGDY